MNFGLGRIVRSQALRRFARTPVRRMSSASDSGADADKETIIGVVRYAIFWGAIVSCVWIYHSDSSELADRDVTIARLFAKLDAAERRALEAENIVLSYRQSKDFQTVKSISVTPKHSTRSTATN